MLTVNKIKFFIFLIFLVASKFKQSFNDAKEFNKAAKAGEELKYAPVIQEDDEEPKKEKSEEKTETKQEKSDEK